jgi:cardiolipin synthase
MSAQASETRDRLRALLRRHGLVRRPATLRRFLAEHDLVFTGGNRLTVWATGDVGLADMLAAIEDASRRIHLETYILRSDQTGLRCLEALRRKAEHGVTVRLLYDAFGSLALDQDALAPLRRAGGEVVAFNPLRRFYPRWLPRRRDHRKILVVDGRVGFTGGLNIGDEYALGLDGGRTVWRDTHLRIEGPAVRELEAVFLESWFRADAGELPWAEILNAAPDAVGEDRVAVVADGPSHRRRVLQDLLVLGLATARRRVRLTSPYFAPDHSVLTAIGAAATRGTAVDLLLAGRTDHPILRRAARSYAPRLSDHGVAIYEDHQAMLHAKSTVVDESWAIAGTSNLDRQSFEHSYEVNLVIQGGDVPRRLAALFDDDLRRATRVDATFLADRTWSERALDRAAAAVLWVV